MDGRIMSNNSVQIYKPKYDKKVIISPGLRKNIKYSIIKANKDLNWKKATILWKAEELDFRDLDLAA
jgi:hypothetical protein